jgi:type IV secretion system protein VirB6
MSGIGAVAQAILDPIQINALATVSNACAYAATLGTALLTIYIILYGMKVALGIEHEKGGAFLIRICKASFIFYLATSPAFFNEWLGDFATEGGNEIATKILNDDLIATKDQYSMLDTIMDKSAGVLFRITEKPGEPAPGAVTPANPNPTPVASETDLGMLDGIGYMAHIAKNLPSIIVGIIYMLLCAAFCLVAAFLLLASKIMALLLLTIGPLAVLCLYFDQTKQYFSNWFNQILNIVVYQILLALFLSVFVGAMGTAVESFAATIAAQDNSTMLLTLVNFQSGNIAAPGISYMLIYAVIGIFLSFQIKPIASAISGGLQLGSAVGGAVRMAANLKTGRASSTTGGAISNK